MIPGESERFRKQRYQPAFAHRQRRTNRDTCEPERAATTASTAFGFAA